MFDVTVSLSLWFCVGPMKILPTKKKKKQACRVHTKTKECLLLFSLGYVVGLEITETPLLNYLGQLWVCWSVCVDELLVQLVVCSHGVSAHEKKLNVLCYAQVTYASYAHITRNLQLHTCVDLLCISQLYIWWYMNSYLRCRLAHGRHAFPSVSTWHLFCWGLEHYDQAKI